MESELARQWNTDPKPRTRLGIFGLLRESFKTINRNMKLMLPALVLMFLLYSHLEFALIHLPETEGKDLESQLEKNPKLFQNFGNNDMHQTQYSDARNVFRDAMLVNLFVLGLSALYLIIFLVFLVATVSSSSEAYTAKNLEQWSRMVISIAMTNGLLCALKLFSYVVFTIFYHEQKESCNEKVAKTLYLPVSGDEV
ncbi:hypothetical protein R6Q57_008088 [Mikania cordata]